MQARPYKQLSDNYVALASSSSMVVLFFSCIIVSTVCTAERRFHCVTQIRAAGVVSAAIPFGARSRWHQRRRGGKIAACHAWLRMRRMSTQALGSGLRLRLRRRL